MGVISGFIIISIAVTCFYFIGLLTFLAASIENKCDMTYMFQYPQFVRIRLKEDSLFPRYALYAYSEGSLTYRVRDMKFDGIPVLFVPGNAGSYKQSRSLASVALRKALDSRPGFHLDFFTADLNEELSGLTGLMLREQMEFVNISLHRILSLYKPNHENTPKSVILIGHSMGGVISQGLLLSQNPPPVHLLITLASPHRRPTIMLDSYMADFYRQLNKHTVNSNTTIITLSGGHDDFLVPTTLTYMPNISVHATSTYVPLAWVMADHKCIVWCKQLVLAITRAIFDSINLQTKQLTKDANYRQRVFHHHLKHNSGIKLRQLEKYELPVKMDDNSEWLENINRQYTLNFRNGSKSSKWYMIRLVPDKHDHTAVTILAVNLELTDWVFACSALHVRGSSRVCLDGMHLTQHSEIVPSIRYKRRLLEINMHDLYQNFSHLTHVVVRIPADDEPMLLHVDTYNPPARQITPTLPRWWKFGWHIVIKETLPEAIRYDILLPEHTQFVNVYDLLVTPLHCSNKFHHAVASLKVPWAHYDTHQYFTEVEKKPLILRLLSSRPLNQNSTASIKLTLDPQCRYSVYIRHSIMNTLAQFARLYSPMLIANVAAITMMVLRGQLISIGDTDYCPLFHSAISTIVKPYYIITFVKLFSKFTFPDVFPKPDAKILMDEATDFFVLPVVLYLTGVGLLYILSGLIVIALVCYESAFHKFFLKILAKAVSTPVAWSDWLMRGFHKLPSVVAIFLVFLCLFTCGALALCLGTVLYFIKLTHMYQDYIENLVVKILRALGRRFKKRKQEEPVEIEGTNGNEAANDAAEEKSNEITSQEIPSNESSNVKSNNEQNTSDGDAGVDTAVASGSDSVNRSKNEDETIVHDSSILSGMHFHFTLFLLWLIVAAINIPTVLTWAHNFKFNPELRPDPSQFPGTILAICAIPLWQLDIPRVNRLFYKELGHVLYGLAILCLIFAPISIYRLNYLITTAIGLVTLHQLLAPKTTQNQETPNVNIATSMETVKAKLE